MLIMWTQTEIKNSISYNIKNYTKEYKQSSTLAFFRIGFGLLMCFSIIRFWSKGWIEELYLLPDFHFSYYGFE